MREKVLCIAVAAALYSLGASAQLQNAWWFVGQGSGLNFDGSGPSFQDSTVMGFDDGSTTVSDSLGNLLFYTNGCKLYNRFHQPMSGNHNLPCHGSGHAQGSGDSLTIGSLLVNGVLSFNVPGSQSKYYLFTHWTYGMPIQNNQAIYYQVIDMNLDGGLGGVELPKNRVAYTYFKGYVGYKFAAVRHANGRDWWLLAVSAFYNNFQYGQDTCRIDRFLFTPDGIVDTLTTLYPNLHQPGYNEISVSFDGTKIAFGTNSKLHITDFDRCTGATGSLSSVDSVTYSNELGNFWFGVSFAPNRKDILYGGTPRYVYQYQLDTLTNQPLSRQQVYYNSNWGFEPPLISYIFLGQLQHAIDGKIYQMVGTQNYWDIPASDTMTKKLRYIENPDSLYPVAQYKMTPPIMHKPALIGLPHQVDWKLGKLVGSECDTITSMPTDLVEKEMLVAQLFPNPATTEATLVLSKPAREEMRLLLYDVLGKVSLRISVQKNQKYVQLNLSALTEGVYFYRLSGKGMQSLNGKLIVTGVR